MITSSGQETSQKCVCKAKVAGVGVEDNIHLHKLKLLCFSTTLVYTTSAPTSDSHFRVFADVRIQSEGDV